MTTNQLSIGEVADAAGVAVSAVRYYDNIGIVSASARVGGKRRFDSDAVGQVSFILRAREAGFSLGEIATLLDDTTGGWREAVASKRYEAIARRDRLNEVIDLLDELSLCGCQAVSSCSRFPGRPREVN